jgi:hypothetical protein
MLTFIVINACIVIVTLCLLAAPGKGPSIPPAPSIPPNARPPKPVSREKREWLALMGEDFEGDE